MACCTVAQPIREAGIPFGPRRLPLGRWRHSDQWPVDHLGENGVLRRIAVLALVLTGVGCAPQTPPAPSETPPSSPVSRTSPATFEGDPFASPQALCDGLGGMGLSTRGWKSDSIDWSCSSAYQEIGQGSTTLMATNLAYYVVGASPTRAHTAKLVLNVNDPTTKSEGLIRWGAAARSLASATRISLPSEVSDALGSGKPIRVEAGAVTYAVERERTRIESFNFVLLDSTAGMAKERAQTDAIRSGAEIFVACKDAIARDLSYPQSSLSGDGEPVQEAGHQSFIVSGESKDVFFCEAYPDGTYKIKAAFAGQYPFKYVASGSF